MRKERGTDKIVFTRPIPVEICPSFLNPPRRTVPTDQGVAGLKQRACSSSRPRPTRSSRTKWDSSCFRLEVDRRGRWVVKITERSADLPDWETVVRTAASTTPRGR